MGEKIKVGMVVHIFGWISLITGFFLALFKSASIETYSVLMVFGVFAIFVGYALSFNK